MNEKNTIRKKIKNKLNSLSDEKKNYSKNQIAKIFFSTYIYKKAKKIFVFFPLPDEISITKIIEQCLIDKKILFLPKINDTEMEFFQIDNNINFFEQLEKNKWNIFEPKPILKKITITSIDENCIFLIPGLAFTKKGQRLGRGKGFYDKFLSQINNLQNISLIGTCYDFQIIENIPTEYMT